MSRAAAETMVLCRVSRCSARVKVTAMGSLLLGAGRRGAVGLRVWMRVGMRFVEVLLERHATERTQVDAECRALDLSEPPLHTLEAGLRVPDAAGHTAERRDAVEQIERLLIGLRRAREVIALLRHAAQAAGALPQGVAAILIAVGELCRLALTGLVAETPRLRQRVGAAVDVAKAGDERP